MKFQLRRFIDTVPWDEWAVVLGLLLSVMVVLFAIDQHGKSKKRRCPTCNQIVREMKK